MHQGQHPCHRGQAAAGVLGVLTRTSTTAATDRRGEAHLWLLLEEALAEARAASPGEVDEVRRRFDGVANALADVGAVARPTARHIASELSVALAVRGLVDPRSFAWSDPPSLRADEVPVRQRGDGWLEAMIEQHLDLVVDLQPSPRIGAQLLANLTPQVRALRAVGSLRNARRLEDLAATLAVTGYAAESDATAKGEVDKGWLSFLESRPRLVPGGDRPTSTRDLTYELGTVDSGNVTLRRLVWSTDVLELEVVVPRHLAGRRWLASAYDDSGQLHLGQPGFDAGGGSVVFGLRPGLRDTVHTLSVRVTYEATRLDEQVVL